MVVEAQGDDDGATTAAAAAVTRKPFFMHTLSWVADRNKPFVSWDPSVGPQDPSATPGSVVEASAPAASPSANAPWPFVSHVDWPQGIKPFVSHANLRIG